MQRTHQQAPSIITQLENRDSQKLLKALTSSLNLKMKSQESNSCCCFPTLLSRLNSDKAQDVYVGTCTNPTHQKPAGLVIRLSQILRPSIWACSLQTYIHNFSVAHNFRKRKWSTQNLGFNPLHGHKSSFQLDTYGYKFLGQAGRDKMNYSVRLDKRYKGYSTTERGEYELHLPRRKFQAHTDDRCIYGLRCLKPFAITHYLTPTVHLLQCDAIPTYQHSSCP